MKNNGNGEANDQPLSIGSVMAWQWQSLCASGSVGVVTVMTMSGVKKQAWQCNVINILNGSSV